MEIKNFRMKICIFYTNLKFPFFPMRKQVPVRLLSGFIQVFLGSFQVIFRFFPGLSRFRKPEKNLEKTEKKTWEKKPDRNLFSKTNDFNGFSMEI